MPNPYLPTWEYIPDAEPKVFGDRVYIYGSHDIAGSDKFCDYKLKCWSAPINDLNNWKCHGTIFRTQPDRDYPSDTDWTDKSHYLYAPDVVERNGKYYLYNYIINSVGVVAVSDRPEGPFKMLSKYKWTMDDEICVNGWFIDPGVLVDDDNKTYIYCGYQRSFMAEVKDNMYEMVEDSEIEHIIPVELDPENGYDKDEDLFFEACSPRKINGTYYMVYSPKRGSRLAYATSDSPKGPFKYRGYIVDNGVNFPGGNDHGGIVQINGQYYIFYHRMTNGTIMSRRGCVEKIEILEDGTIPPVEMTSLGFEDALNPYKETPSDIACVLIGNAFITERDIFDRVITNITEGDIIGYKYYDFGDDFGSKTMKFFAEVNGMGVDADIHIYAAEPGKDICNQEEKEEIINKAAEGKTEPKDIDAAKTEAAKNMEYDLGEELGTVHVSRGNGIVSGLIKAVTGRKAIYLRITTEYHDWTSMYFKGRSLFELKKFVFTK